MEIEFGFFEQYQTMGKKKQPIPFLKKPTLLVFYARPCIVGEFYSDEYTCDQCRKGTNTYEAQTERGLGCEDCLENAICDGAKTYPMAGFVRMNEFDFIFVKCFNENAC